MKNAVYVACCTAGFVLVYLAWRGIVPITLAETLGFLTGVVCVWLIVKENIWNWPVGIANNVLYVVVFWRARLFADMSLQFIYIALGILGLYRWLYGGEKHGTLRISRISITSTIYLGI